MGNKDTELEENRWPTFIVWPRNDPGEDLVRLYGPCMAQQNQCSSLIIFSPLKHFILLTCSSVLGLFCITAVTSQDRVRPEWFPWLRDGSRGRFFPQSGKIQPAEWCVPFFFLNCTALTLPWARIQMCSFLCMIKYYPGHWWWVWNYMKLPREVFERFRPANVWT